MSYCQKWQLLGLLIGLSPFALALVLAVLAALIPRQFWLKIVLFTVVGVTVLVVGRVTSLVLWNGIRPAICNSM